MWSDIIGYALLVLVLVSIAEATVCSAKVRAEERKRNTEGK